MAVRSSDQISITDVSDAYSVMLTSEAYTFMGSTNAAKAASTTTQVIAMLGPEQVTASVVASEIEKPAGVTVSVDSNSDSKAPILTISVTTAVKVAGEIIIPVHVSDVVIQKKFSFGIAFTGSAGTSVTVKSTSVSYQAGTSGTTAPTGTWSETVPAVGEGQYLWTKTVVTYSDNKSTTAYSVSRNATNGTNGTSVTVSSQSVTYQTSSSGTTAPTGTWNSAVPSVAAGQYLWTKTVVTYSDGKSTTSYSVSRNGTNGQDAITMSITSSNGTIFKNSAITTTLTAHVYRAGVELTQSQIAALGTIKWYKDGSTTAITGTTYNTLVISAGDVQNKATYIAQLEG